MGLIQYFIIFIKFMTKTYINCIIKNNLMKNDK